MQLAFLPDYFDGTRPMKGNLWPIFLKFFKLSSCLIRVTPIGFRISIPNEKIREDPQLAHTFIQTMETDMSMSMLIKTYGDYLVAKGKNYVFTKGLAKALAQTSTNVTSKRMPDSFVGYLEIPGLKDLDGDIILGVFVNIFKMNGGHYLNCGFVTDLKRLSVGHLNLEIKKDVSLLKSIQEYSYIQRDVVSSAKNGALTIATTDQKHKDYPYVKTLVNAIMYLTSSNADLTHKINNLSTKKSKHDAQSKLYTKQPFIVAGDNFDYELIRKQLPDNIKVTSHWRWQVCGVGRTEHKWIFINEHLRNAKK